MLAITLDGVPIFGSTPVQDKALEWARQKHNADTGETLTLAQFVQGRAAEALRPIFEAYPKAVAAAETAAFTVADDATKAQVLALLGVTI